ncbi:hypothetical protein MNL09_06780 [Bartonella krasnovii]|nr:hypothetical protein MNL09_06780 [Bartonella krasnovii]
MKKITPHPFPSSSIQELIKLYEKLQQKSLVLLPKEEPLKAKRLSTILEEDEGRLSL